MPIPRRPKRDDYPSGQDGATAWLLDDRNYHRECAEISAAALKPFADAANHASEMTKASALTGMDYRDYFMWQTNRKLCMKDFNDAIAALEEIKRSEQ